MQLDLKLPKRPRRRKKRGGPRPNSGRKPNEPGRPRLRHEARPVTKSRFPVHVTKRLRRDVPRLRNFELCAVLRRAFVYGCRRDGFRICQFSIQGNHIHLICEADSNVALARGIQGWSVRMARGLNRELGRNGQVFDDRYHLEVIKSPQQTRHALCYVLQNARRHGEWIDRRYHGMDPFSSAWWFDGWKDDRWRNGLSPPEMRTVAPAETYLLNVAWRQHGLIAIDEVPAAVKNARARVARDGTPN